MSSFWGNLIGAYLLTGVVLYGLGMMARARWIASGKMKPPGEREKRLQMVGWILGVFLWPLALLMILVWRLKNRRKAIKYMGFCEHRTEWEPICNSCRKDIDAEEKVKSTLSRYIISSSSRTDAKAELRAADSEDARRRLAEVRRRIDEEVKRRLEEAAGKPQVPAVPDELKRQLQALSGPPDEKGTFQSYYICSNCGARHEGFPADVDRDRKPLCMNCRT